MTAPSFRETTSTWARIGLLSFGGPAAQFALMHKTIVDEKKWLSERDYLNALSFCMLLPGPEAMQLATYSGWRLHGVFGGLTSGLLFVMPGALVILALASIYLFYGEVPALQSAFLGIQAAILVIVLEALNKVARRSLTGSLSWVIAGASFLALFLLAIPFPIVVLTAGVLGLFLSRDDSVGDHELNTPDGGVSPLKTLSTIAIWLAIWWLPIGALWLVFDATLLSEIGVFFSKLATVSFGGAYAVLAYVAQDAVQTKAWLSTQEMLDGLGLAETTPGPLILVTEFVGFLAGARAEGGTSWSNGLLAALTTLWATFAPCFLWVFTGAPYIEWIASKRRLRNALSCISAAVVGVILNLSIWFALHVLFSEVSREQWGVLTLSVPNATSLNLPALLLAILAAVMLLVLKRSVIFVIFFSALLGYLGLYIFPTQGF
ncbi:MAG: chromate efflux transporter [Rhodobacteraceae bacterium]|nr:chromate efflux transporter [Paracoccaceae bacterium]